VRRGAAAAAPSAGSFAARVEVELCRRYGDARVGRVVECWRRTDGGVEHAAVLDAAHPYMRQEARSFLPGLTARPFWDVSNTAWATALAEEWHVVRDEFRAVALRGATSLAAKGNNVWAAAADAGSAASYGPDWRTLVLMDRTTWDPTNAALFPETAALLHRAKVPCVEAFFASMKPDSKISAHSDSCNFVLTAHLGLEIPPGGCKIAVGNETRFWENGEVMLFDTSLLHDAENPTTENRYILMLRVWHPELDEIEVQALQFIYDCLDVPDLLSDDPLRVFRAESELAGLRQRAWRRRDGILKSPDGSRLAITSNALQRLT